MLYILIAGIMSLDVHREVEHSSTMQISHGCAKQIKSIVRKAVNNQVAGHIRTSMKKVTSHPKSSIRPGY